MTAFDILKALECDRLRCVCHRSAERGHGDTHCPVHDDQRPSFSVAEENGTVLWHCQRGCSQDDVLKELTARGLVSAPNGHHPSRIVRRHRAEPEPDDFPWPVLPMDFWSERSYLEHIRDAALSRQRSPDALLHVVLARVLAATPYRVRLPAIVGAPSNLSYFANIVGPTHSGKTTVERIGCDLIDVLPHLAALDRMPIGSGEGFLEWLFVFDKQTKQKEQEHHNAYFYTDEIESLTAIKGRQGSTLMSTLRTIWTGGTAGQTNATKETYRKLPAYTYVFGVVLLSQITAARVLLDPREVRLGSPQRFAWASAMHPAVSSERRPAWPGKLPWSSTELCQRAHLIDNFMSVAPAMWAEIQHRDAANVSGATQNDDFLAHADLLRLKVAAALAILDYRFDITEDDWRLAGVIQATSFAMMKAVNASLHAETAQREKFSTERTQRREVAVTRAVANEYIIDTAVHLGRLVYENEGITVRDLKGRLAQKRRDVYEDALTYAVDEHWIAEQSEEGQGHEKRALYPTETWQVAMRKMREKS